MILGRYSFGIGDRFGRQGKPLLEAIIRAGAEGLEVTPVWNKSHREHTIIGTEPMDVRREADEVVAACGWTACYFVDADHVSLANVDLFVESSDFFTLDVADFIGKPADEAQIDEFVGRYAKYAGSSMLAGLGSNLEVTRDVVYAVARKYLPAVKQAGVIYRHIEAIKGKGNFITEVSMDETAEPQSAVEMLFILAAIAEEGIPLQTVAPKFTGRFNKGVDYSGSVEQFSRHFEQVLGVVDFAVKEFGLPAGLKLSVHSGSDKFSIYPAISRALKKFETGVHIKTAGTTWLAELEGLASAGGEGLAIAKQVYVEALARMDELCGPYREVIDIDRSRLPSEREVRAWDGARFVAALRHEPGGEHYNPDFRQLLHVGYKVAARMGRRYLDALERYEHVIALRVTENIYERHILPIFLQDGPAKAG